MGRRHFWLDLFACFLIPVYTLLFAGSVEWFGTNFSVIAVTGPDHYRGFVYWGILAGSYFFVILSRLAFGLPRRWIRTVVRLLAVCAVLALAYVLLMIDLQFIILVMRRQDPVRWAGPLRACWGMAAVCAILFAIPRMVSTALEVFFTLSATLLARRVFLLQQEGA